MRHLPTLSVSQFSTVLLKYWKYRNLTNTFFFIIIIITILTHSNFERTTIFLTSTFTQTHTMLHAFVFSLSNKMSLARGTAVVFLLFALYCGLDPFEHSPIAKFPDFEAKKVDIPPWSEVPNDTDKQNLLQNSEIKFLNQVQGPESIVFDPLGRGPYTGLADGRILFWNGQSWFDFAYTSPNR